MTAFSKNTYSFPLDIKRRTGVKLLGVNGDTANRFIVTLQDAGVNLDLTGLYVRAVFRRSDGVTVLQSESDSPANITKTTGGVVTIDVLNGSFRDGDNDMEIQVLDGDPDTGDVLITSARMLFRVRKELNSDDATESSHEYTVLQQFIDGLGNMTVTVETLAAGSSATAGLTIGDDYSYELALGIPRGADGSDGVGIASIQALESIIDGSYALKIVMTDSTIYTFPLPFYIKPAGGIPKTDLAAGVQASLRKADTALQEHQSLAGYATQTWVGQQGYLTEHQDLSAYRTASDQDVIDDAQDAAIAAKYTKPSGGIPTDDIANGAVTGYKIGDHEVTPDKLGEMEALRILGNNSLSPVNVKELTGAQVTAMLAAMSGASASSAGGKGLVPAPAAGDNVKFLRGDGTWQTVSGGSDNVFVATVGVTTFDELTAAMNAGKILGARYVNTTSESAYGNVYTAWLYAFVPGGTADTYSSFTFTATNKMAGGTLYITASPGSTNTTDWEVYDAQPDLAPTQNSLNAVSSGGVYTALSGKLATTGNAYRTASIPFGVVDNTSTETAFTATVQGITELRDGVCAYIRNGTVTSAAGCTLNVNNLGAKPIYSTVAATTAVTTTFNVNYTMLFIYNSTRVSGGCWDMYYGYDANTTYTPAKLGFGYATCSTAAATAAKTASLSSYALNTGGIVAVKFTNAVPANATLNINSKGAKAIYYKGAAITDGVIKAGDTVTFIYSTYYHIISIDRQPVVDSTPTANSDNLITSGGVASALSAKIGTADAAQYVNLSSNGLTDGTTVTCSMSPLTILTLFSTQPKVFFILNSLILFTPSYADANTGTVKMYCAYDTGTEINEYYITLQPASASSMT
ncbi:MAG: hypothetical protein II025_01485, partial [Ruminococcus sp.]|nr:hypothetical protein [Ruminococcus sp.]